LIDNIINGAGSCLQNSMHRSEPISKHNGLPYNLPLSLSVSCRHLLCNTFFERSCCYSVLETINLLEAIE